MKAETLNRIKTQIKKFEKLFDVIEKYMNKEGKSSPYPVLSILGMLIHNAGFEFKNEHQIEAERELFQIKETLEAIKDYEEWYLPSYVYDQISMIIEGEIHMENKDIPFSISN